MTLSGTQQHTKHNTHSHLALSMNNLASLPDSIAGLSTLKHLEVSDNRLQTLPAALGTQTRKQASWWPVLQRSLFWRKGYFSIWLVSRQGCECRSSLPPFFFCAWRLERCHFLAPPPYIHLHPLPIHAHCVHQQAAWWAFTASVSAATACLSCRLRWGASLGSPTWTLA